MISHTELDRFFEQLVATVQVKGGCVRCHQYHIVDQIIDHARHQGRMSDQRVNTEIEEF